jgi:Transcription elongation factor, GreA/GreB, C-term
MCADKSDRSASVTSGEVKAGMRVEIELVSRNGKIERLAVTIVPDAQADFASGFLGEGTPLAKAILGQTVGSLVPYPVADMRAVRILSASASGQAPADEAAARREAVLREAAEKSEFTSAQIYATSADTKWGDYDADSLDPAKWKSDES